jgi:hypothetical protein
MLRKVLLLRRIHLILAGFCEWLMMVFRHLYHPGHGLPTARAVSC